MRKMVNQGEQFQTRNEKKHLILRVYVNVHVHGRIRGNRTPHPPEAEGPFRTHGLQIIPET
jgi:hypothetical protein